MNITIGTKYITSKVVFKVVGIRYGKSESIKDTTWKSESDILDSLEIYVQVISLPSENVNTVLSIEWIKLEDLKLTSINRQT